MNPIGIMQGRLSPPLPDRLQGFPWQTWEQEFERAAALGFDCIEWIFEAEGREENPLLSDDGVDRINALQREHGVAVRSVCADYFMPHPLFRGSADQRAASGAVLERLVEQASRVGAQLILMPVLEISEIQSDEERDLLYQALRVHLPAGGPNPIRVGLEAELDGDAYRRLVAGAAHPQVCAYYDTGNNAAQGNDVAAGIRELGDLVGGVHVKDRLRGGGSVPLGEGATDFPGVFAALRDVGYQGHVLLQTMFGSDFSGDAARHLAFVRRLLEP